MCAGVMVSVAAVHCQQHCSWEPRPQGAAGYLTQKDVPCKNPRALKRTLLITQELAAYKQFGGGILMAAASPL